MALAKPQTQTYTARNSHLDRARPSQDEDHEARGDGDDRTETQDDSDTAANENAVTGRLC